MERKPRVIVCQHGARHRYAIPRMFEQAGMLEAFYTDSCEYSLLGKIATAMGPLARGAVRRLANHKVVGVPEAKIFCSDSLVFDDICRLLFRRKYFEYDRWCRVLSKKLIKWWRSDCYIVYNMFCENCEFLKYLKKSSTVKIIIDIYIHPYALKIVQTEHAMLRIEAEAHRGIQNISPETIRDVFALGDILLCPSEFVADGVRQLCPEHAHKIRFCSYGSSIDYGGKINKPDKGKFFWAGGDWVRKGLHYLAEAADELKLRYPDMDFRIAGITDLAVRDMERFDNLKFLGKLNKEQMQKEFLSSDAFVFPTLSEGMAGVVIEAFAAGCPVITTRCAGIDAIDNYKNGVIVPERDSQALVIAIETLYLDRYLRNSISEETLLLAKEYTEDAWTKRLTQIIKETVTL